jgi:dolichyl-diphosphooligosaccharide--protein glycosyltransferase
MRNEDGAASLIKDHPDLEEPLNSILAVDEQHETWTFDDVPVDSGPFGELVSSGVVESVGDEYRLSDPSSVRAVLGQNQAPQSRSMSTLDMSTPDLSPLAVDRSSLGFVAAAVTVVALVRLHTIPYVYRDGDVVLSGNDPYYYRYWVEETIAESTGSFDFGALAVFGRGLPDGEPLMVATLWWFAELIGNGPAAVADVLAWYPVLSAIITAILIYWMTSEVTGDKRVGVAAVLLLALIPGHALRTSIGFADHHAFDYIWLAATATILVALSSFNASHRSQSRLWLLSGGLGLAITGQILAWEAGPLLIMPIGIIVVLGTFLTVNNGASPIHEWAPILPGLALAAVFTQLIHELAGWHTTSVAAAPVLLFAGVLGVLVLGEIVGRTTGDVNHLAVADAIGGIAVLLLLRYGLTEIWFALQDRLGILFDNRGIAETLGLFSTDSFGFIFLLGFTLVLALPAMTYGIRRSASDDGWLVITAYAWFMLLLAAIQVRFVGEFATFGALFAGVGFVWTGAWIDAIAPLSRQKRVLSIPDKGTLITLTILFLLVGSLGATQVVVKTSQVTIDDGTYHSSQFIANESASLNETYPGNYVFSTWGRNRVYNYFTNGESRSYRYAQDNFGDFLASTNPDARYSELEGTIGYVVLSTNRDIDNPHITYTRLAKALGSRTDEAAGVGHYRAIYLSPERHQVVHRLVDGARVAGPAPANATVTLETDVAIPNGRFTYARQTSANESGRYEIRVAQPGTYRIKTGNQTRRVQVPNSAVENGARVPV